MRKTGEKVSGDTCSTLCAKEVVRCVGPAANGADTLWQLQHSPQQCAVIRVEAVQAQPQRDQQQQRALPGPTRAICGERGMCVLVPMSLRETQPSMATCTTMAGSSCSDTNDLRP